MTVEEEEVNTLSRELPSENSETSKESSPSSLEERNKRAPFWIEDYVSGGELSEEEFEHNLVLFTLTSYVTIFEEAV